MKRILLLSLLLLPIVALAQYPTFSNKQKLGVQTTGDGLIFRGTTINNIPNYTPSNVNNAYFHLDTVQNKLYLYNATAWQLVYPTTQFDTTTLNVYLKISDTTAMLLPYFRDSDTTSLNLINRFALKLNISDTATMLTPYMKKADTISLSNRIDLKFNISDTTILSNRITTNANNIIIINNKLATKLDTIYTKFKDVVKMIVNKDTINIGSSLTDGYAINIIGDSVNVDSIILDARYPDRDTTNELQDITFATTAGIVTISGSKIMNLDTLYNSVIDSVNLLIRDSIAAFTPLTEGYGINIIGDSINVDTSIIFTQSDTITLSNRIDLKLNISDTLDMLAPYLREADTISLSNRINTKLDTIYVNYQTNVDVITNKDTINITPLTEGFGINIIADSINIDSAVILATQQKQIAYVKNQSGVTMYKGQAVYSSGSSGNNKLVQLASSNTEQSSSKTFGVVESDVIPNGGHGYIITFGLLSGFNTNALTEDSSVYLSNTPGELTTTKPQAPLHLVTIGVCIRQQQNNGSIFVKIQNGFEFDELHDVRLTDLVDKASIYYNSSEDLWRDTTAALLVSDTASMLNPYLRKLDTITLSDRIDLKFNTVDTSILGYVTTYSNQYNINGNKTFNNTVSVDSLNATKQAKIQSLTVGKGGYITVGGGSGGISSTAFGFEALKNNTLGDWNTAIGYQALLNNDTAWSNVAIGSNALKFNTGGEYNTAIGVDALDLNIVGNYNTAIGYSSGNGSKGSNNIFIGNNSGHLDSVNNVLVIGSVLSPLLTGILSENKKLGININPLNITSTFQVNSPISDAVKISSNTNSTNLELANNSGNSVFIKSSNRNMTLQTDTTALMYLNGETNRVGILTMTPEQALEVAGTIRVDSLGSNTLTPTKLVGANDANDLSDVKLGTGLSFSNDTLKIADNIINSGDTATLLRQDFIPLTSNQVIWTQGNKKLLKYFTQVYRNGQLLKDVQYTISSDSIVTLEDGSYKLGDIITVIAIDNIVALAGSGGMITLQGDVTGSGTSSITTSIGANKVTNTMLAGSISDSKLNTITTVGKVSNSATTATDVNTNNAIVLRDASGDFSAGIITASLNGNASTATNVAYSGLTGTVPTWNQNTTGNAATVTTNANLTGDVTSTGNNTSIATEVIVNADINASAAIAVSKLAASTISGITLGNNLNTLTISSPLTGTSYNGSSAVSIGLQAATTSVAGSMSAADKTKLDGIAAGAQVNVPTNLAQGTRTTTTVPITSSTGTPATLNVATTSLAGVMSSADKTKLDGIASGATANTGTVTSVATGYGLSGGTITTTGTLVLDSAVVFSQIRDSIVDVAIGNDTIKILKQEYAPATTSVLTWTVTPKFPIQLKQYILVFRNGQLLINDQYNLTDTNQITIVSNSFKIGSNYTVVTVSGIGSVGTGVFPNLVYPEAGIALSTGSAWASSIPNNSANWNIAFNDKINNAAFTGTTTKTLTLTQYDGGTFTPTFNDLQGVTEVTAGTGLTGGTITSTGTVAVNFGVVAPVANPTFTGTVSGITKSMVGLGNVDNTSDANKPISTATQTALDLKQNALSNASASVSGILTSTDWTTFNNKQPALGFTPANSTITINTTSPLQGGGDLSNNRTLSILSASDSQSGIVTTTSQLFGGSKVFKNRVTVDSVLTLNTTTAIPNQILGINTVGNVNSVGKLSLGAGLSITSSTLLADTNLLITRYDTASMLINYLSSGVAASTYQTKLTNPVTGTGTNDYIVKFTSTGSTIGNSTLIDNGTTISTSSILSTTNYATLDAGNNTHRLTNTLSGNQTWNTPYGFITSYSGNWYFNIVNNDLSTDFPILSVLSNSSTKKSGIALNSQLTANDTYTPAITFSSLSNSGAYYSTYAAIIGKKTGTGGEFGDSGNYNSGHIEFYGTAQVSEALGGIMLTPPNMVVGVGVGIGYDTPPTIKGRLLVSERIGVATNDPTNTVDINGTLRVRTTNTVASTALLGKDNDGVVGGVIIGSGLTLSNSTLSLSASSGGFITTNNNYTVTITDTWIVFNNNFDNIIVTLPDASTSLGRTLYFRNVAAGSIVSAGTANIIDNTITTGTPNNNILGAGNTNVKWCTLVSNGQYWIKMQAGSL